MYHYWKGFFSGVIGFLVRANGLKILEVCTFLYSRDQNNNFDLLFRFDRDR